MISEENKDKKQEPQDLGPQETQKPPEKKPPEAPPAQPAKPPQEKSVAKPEEAPKKPERPKECLTCGNSIKDNWYYREGKYYCGKGCWKKAKKSKEKNEAESKKTDKAK